VHAYAFLTEGAIEPLSGFGWPAPNDGEMGDWVDAGTAPPGALRGSLPRDLPYWLDDELWGIELAGTLLERPHLVVAERARLLGRIDAWTDALAWELVEACVERVEREAAADSRRAAELEGYVADMRFYARDAGVAARAAGVVAKMSAVAVASGVEDRRVRDERVANERAWQAAWLSDRLGL
jgi:hypothetical protein